MTHISTSSSARDPPPDNASRSARGPVYDRGNLSAATASILRRAADVSGKKVIVTATEGLADYANVHVANPDRSFSHIDYNADYQGDRDYIIAHECGHIIRQHLAPAEMRWRSVRAAANYEAAVQAHHHELVKYRARAPPGTDVESSIHAFYRDVTDLLISGPPDTHIERRLHSGFAELRPVQARGFRRQVELAGAGMASRARCEPAHLFRTAATLTYVLVAEVGETIGQPDVADLFRQFADEQQARALRGILHDIGDQGHVGDVETTDQWAECLGLQGWYHWADWETGQRRTPGESAPSA